MRIYGLTGGIASGKSTVAALFAERGVPVVDADAIAREVVAPGQPAYDDIVAAFGPEILDGARHIDRKRLGAIVFADAAQRRRLNAITHPRIAAASQAQLQALREAGRPLALYEAALLVENGIQRSLDGLIVVSVDAETQRARLCRRDDISQAEAEQRISAQAPLADKLAAATHVIDNRGSLDEVRRQVDALVATLTHEAAHG